MTNTANINQEQTAGLTRRIAAIAYDTIIVFALLTIGTIIVMIFTRGHIIPPGQIWFTCYLIAIIFGYFATSWIYGGQTVGMRTWKLKLHTRSSEPMDIWRALMRFGFAIPSLSLCGLGLFWVLIDNDKLSWHDRWSRTLVRRC